jgi:tripartite-type tricarboxylate transporter receptor subunit TctC
VEKGFSPLGFFGAQPLYLVVPGDFPANTFGELIKLAQAKPGELNYASSGNGTPMHLTMELIMRHRRISLVHVPFKGASQGLMEAAVGRIAVAFGGPLSAAGFLAEKRIKVLAVASPVRLPYLPQVPTFTELGIPGLEVGYWYGLVAPAGTPKEISEKLTSALTKVLQMPEIQSQLQKAGVEGQSLTGPQFGEFMAADVHKWKRVAEEAGIVSD